MMLKPAGRPTERSRSALRAETAMLTCLVLSVAVSVGQTEAPPEVPAPPLKHSIHPLQAT